MIDIPFFKRKSLGHYQAVRPAGNIHEAVQTSKVWVIMKYISSPNGSNNYQHDYGIFLREFRKAVKKGALKKIE